MGAGVGAGVATAVVGVVTGVGVVGTAVVGVAAAKRKHSLQVPVVHLKSVQLVGGSLVHVHAGSCGLCLLHVYIISIIHVLCLIFWVDSG